MTKNTSLTQYTYDEEAKDMLSVFGVDRKDLALKIKEFEQHSNEFSTWTEAFHTFLEADRLSGSMIVMLACMQIKEMTTKARMASQFDRMMKMMLGAGAGDGLSSELMESIKKSLMDSDSEEDDDQ
jgi:hypothetical protein